MRIHELDCLLPRPFHRVHAGVDHQAAGAPRVEREHADPVEVAAVETHLVGEPLGIETPALNVGSHLGVSQERRQLVQLLADRYLQVMPRHRLVVGERLRLVARPRLGSVRVHVIAPRPGAVLGRLAVVGDGRVALLVGEHAGHLAGSARQTAEPAGDRLVGARQRALGDLHDLLARLEVDRSVAA